MGVLNVAQIRIYATEICKDKDLKLLGIYFSTEFSEDKGNPGCIADITSYLSKITEQPVLVIKVRIIKMNRNT